MNRINHLSLTTVPFETYALVNNQDIYLESGTGFFFNDSEKTVRFITNWHLVTGRCRENSALSRKQGAIPYKIKFKLHASIENPGNIHTQKINTLELKINDHDGKSPIWTEHPIYRHQVDLVCIEVLKDSLNGCEYNLLSKYPEFDERYIPNVMDNISVIGYPLGFTGGSDVLPIYKSGYIASEPVVNYGNLPLVLIDCKTNFGMSGSPVISKHSGILSVPTIQIGTFSAFLGVYSGRYTQELNGENLEIGMVWKKSALEELLNNGVSGFTMGN